MHGMEKASSAVQRAAATSSGQFLHFDIGIGNEAPRVRAFASTAGFGQPAPRIS